MAELEQSFDQHAATDASDSSDLLLKYLVNVPGGMYFVLSSENGNVFGDDDLARAKTEANAATATRVSDMIADDLKVVFDSARAHLGPETHATSSEERGDSGEFEVRVDITFTHSEHDFDRWMSFQREVVRSISPLGRKHITLVPDPRDANISH